MSEERMTAKTVDICTCGLVMHQLDDDDYDTLGATEPVCCPNCGNEKFQTIDDLQSQLAEAKKKIVGLKVLLERCSNVFEILSYKKQTASLRSEITEALKEKDNDHP